MREQDDARALFDELMDGWRNALDAGRVGAKFSPRGDALRNIAGDSRRN